MAKSATKAAKPAASASKEDKPAKAATGAAAAKKPAAGLMKPVQPSKELGAVVGDHAMPRTEVISKVWEYIRKHNLQNPANKREILADAKLKAVFGQDKATMFEMNKLLSGHLK
jgi:upstream activation factor subunit UAF30